MPRNRKSTTDIVISSYYKEVSKNQIFLDKEEELNLFRSYQKLKKNYIKGFLKVPGTKEELNNLYLGIKKENRSAAKLSIDYNSKIKGRNKKVSKDIKESFQNQTWQNINLPLEICYNIVDSLEKEPENLRLIRENLNEIEEIICKANLMAALSVSKKFASNIFGIDLKDAVQEANKGILEAIEKYDPEYVSPQGISARFFTYAYENAKKKIKEFIMNQSRLVRLPRNQLERIFIIIEASNNVHNSKDTLALTREVNHLLYRSNKPPLSEEEVLESITLLSGTTISLDRKNDFTSEENSKPRTLGDLLPDTNPTPEAFLTKESARQELLESLKNILDEIEYLVVYYKYLQIGDEQSLKEVQNILSEQGKSFSRERINQIKKGALKKLSEHENIKTLLQEQL